MKTQHRWLVIYDIMSTSRLRVVARMMESYGTRIQRSVFEMHGAKNLAEVLRNRLLSVLADVDSVMIIPLCMDDYEKTVRLGTVCKNPDSEQSDACLFL